jgi:predicted naringenin-chalcone synthase
VSHAAVTGRGAAVPDVMPQDALWEGFFAAHYGHDELARAIWRRSGVVTRHGVADPRTDDVSSWSTGQRMRRFVAEALPLGKEAVTAALDDAGVEPREVDQLTVVSCTGYATPGLDVLLARDLDLRIDAQRLHIGHMGCYAALPALATAADAATARGQTAVVACVELTSLHIQPSPPPGERPDRDQVVAHALFSDAAAAVVVRPPGAGSARRADAGPGLEILDLVARTDVGQAPLMTWDVTDLGFRMGLSPRVPKVLAEHVVGAIDDLAARNGITRGAITRWAIHPGGPRIVDVVADRLDLDDDAVADSRAVLAAHGNCSSATVLLILDRMLATGRIETGRYAVALAFGPGLTLYAALLRGT